MLVTSVLLADLNGKRTKFVDGSAGGSIVMEDLLIALLQFLAEFLLEILSWIPFDWPLGSHGVTEPDSITEKCICWFIIGCGLAVISFLFLRHTWISHPALRITNLFLAPISAAYLSEAFAWRRSRRNSNIIPRHHFWTTFWFTLGLVAVRFAYAIRV
jgi:hypothetical protein